MVDCIEALADVVKELLRSKGLVVVGIGNVLRGDDGIGVLIARKLKKMLRGLRNVKVVVCESGLENITHILMDYKPKHILIIDAVYVEGGEPGDIYVLDINDLDYYQSVTTHHIPLKLTLNYLMGHLNTDVTIIGIQVRSVGLGEEMSREVINAGEYLLTLFRRVVEELDSLDRV
ncbi:MAG: hydrogenase maturation protease [Sulfolobales archaeon]